MPEPIVVSAMHPAPLFAARAPAHTHEQRETLAIDVYVPDHPDRTDSPTFRATRRKLIESNPDARCEVCGVTEGLELHHNLVEWAYSGAVDWAKMRRLCPNFRWDEFDPRHPETFIDSEWNANRVLCKRHHTGPNAGIHWLPYPLWLVQRFKRDNFAFTPEEAAGLHHRALADADLRFRAVTGPRPSLYRRVLGAVHGWWRGVVDSGQ